MFTRKFNIIKQVYIPGNGSQSMGLNGECFICIQMYS